VALSSIGLPELLVILVIILLLFGAKRLPDMARSLGKSSKAFKEGMKEGASEDDQVDDKAEKPAS